MAGGWRTRLWHAWSSVQAALSRLARVLRRRKGLLLGALAVALLGIGLVIAAATLARSYATELTGRLAGVRELSFVEGTQADGGLSPNCGCDKIPVNSWRGITFASRRLTISRHGGAPWTEWIISNAEPHNISLGGKELFLQGEALRIRSDGRFDPQQLIDARGPGAEVLQRWPIKHFAVSLYSREAVHVAMFGSVPVGAWVPFPGSRVQLSSDHSPFFEDEPRPKIEEKYPSDVGIDRAISRPGHGKGDEPQVYPFGDFLGPNIVFWTSDPRAQIPGSTLDSPGGPGIITAIVLRKCCFSAQLDVAPVTSGFLAGLRRYGEEKPGGSAEVIYNQDVKPGHLEVEVERPLDHRQYEELRERVRARPRVGVRVRLPSGLPELPAPVQALAPREQAQIRESGYYIEGVHYPPLPKFAGFNVFGPLRQVAFKGVRGSLMVADKTVNLAGSADLELGEVSGLRDKSGEELIAAPLSTSAESADLEFSAVGTASVNGVSKTTVNSHLEPKLAIIGTVLTLAAASVGLISGLWRLRKSRQDSM